MEHLELVRVHDTGTDLVVRAPDGTHYLIAMDEALRRCVRTPMPTPAAVEPDPHHLSPREIQTRIRAGASAERVAEESGTDLERVRRYEAPVLAERDHIARQARAVEVSSPLGHEGYRAAFGDEPASLGEMVRTRLRAFGVDPASLSWDAYKLDAGTWRVVAGFDVPEDSAKIGEEPPAEWTFHPSRRHLENVNRWAQVLSEWEPWDVLPSQRRLVAVDRPFDVEDGAEPEPVPPAPQRRPEAGREHTEDENLLEVLAKRRGTRVGEDEDGDDALAHLIAERRRETDEEHPAQRRHQDTVPGQEPLPGQEDASDEQAEAGPGRTDGLQEPDGPHRSWPPLRRVPDPIPATSAGSGSGSGHENASEDERPHRKRRSQVPSWDEIVFGRSARGDDDED